MRVLHDTYGSFGASIRFRRWNRKRYAAFCSVGRVVTIGCLDKKIAEASLGKQQGVIRPCTCRMESGRVPEVWTDSGGSRTDMPVEVSRVACRPSCAVAAPEGACRECHIGMRIGRHTGAGGSYAFFNGCKSRNYAGSIKE